LLAYADGVSVVRTASASIAADAKASNRDGGGQSAVDQAQAVVGDANADNDAKGGIGDVGVPWDAWGPRATAASEYSHVGGRVVFGERMATIEAYPKFQICIRDYNSYGIRQARAPLVAKGHGDGWCASRGEGQDEGENARTFHPKVTRRVAESSTLQGGQWFEEGVTTALPHLDVDVDLPSGSMGWVGI
jgi:hypothetical protein